MKNMYEATLSLYESLYKANGELSISHPCPLPTLPKDTSAVTTEPESVYESEIELKVEHPETRMVAEVQVDDIMQGLDDLFYDDANQFSLPIASQEMFVNELLLASVVELEPAPFVPSDASDLPDAAPYSDTISPLLLLVPNNMASSVKPMFSSTKRRTWQLATRPTSPTSTKPSSKLLSFHQWLSKWSQFRKRATVCNA